MNALLDPNPSQLIDIDAITPDPNQPRKEFNGAGNERLAKSILRWGVLQAIIVRPATAAGQVMPGQYVIVAGERRWRAAKKAGLAKIPATVREVGEASVTGLQLTENDIRESLKALERAGGHQQMRARGMTNAQIAEETGDSEPMVRDSLKLLELIPEVRKAWSAEEIDYSKALEIAKVPAVLQSQVLADAVELNADGEPMSCRQLKEHIHACYRLELKRAPFAIADAQLVPAAGSCNACPMRTGAQPDMFADIKADFCLNRICYQGKCDAHLVAAEKSGVKVLSAEEVKEVFVYDSPRPGYHSDYVLADEKPHGSKKNFGQLVDRADIVLAKNPQGQVLELVERKSLPKEPGADKPKKAGRSDEELKLDREYAVRVETAKRVRTAVLEGVGSSNNKSVWMSAAFDAIFQRSRSSAKSELYKNRGWPKDFKIAKTIDTADEVLMREMLFDLAFSESWGPFRHGDGYQVPVVEACKLYGVELKKIERQVKGELEAAWKAKAEKKLATVKEVVDEAELTAGWNGDRLRKISPGEKACGATDGKGVGAKPGLECVHRKGHAGTHSNGKRTWANPDCWLTGKKKAKATLEKTTPEPIAEPPKKKRKLVIRDEEAA